jgi:cysteine synthase
VAISRILGCHGIAVLPENMSKERFDWLDKWVVDPADIVRTPGSESNVKEIYDTCAELDRDPSNIIFNQFCEFGNYLVHRNCTGPALEKLFHALTEGKPSAKLAAYVSASGSGGTLAAGDHLKQALGARIVAVEAVECPTLLCNGFGEHNIQGIGDKHVPYIHNVMNTDMIAAVSDEHTDSLLVLFNTEEGRKYLVERRGIDADLVDRLSNLGLSSICNMLAAIKTARYYDLGAEDVIMTIATDGAAMYGSEIDKVLARDFPTGFDAVGAGEVWGRSLAATTTDHLLEMSFTDRQRVFNLGYFTWVEQQGVSLEEFSARSQQSFWDGLQELVPAWDAMIDKFNAESGVGAKIG